MAEVPRYHTQTFEITRKISGAEPLVEDVELLLAAARKGILTHSLARPITDTESMSHVHLNEGRDHFAFSVSPRGITISEQSPHDPGAESGHSLSLTINHLHGMPGLEYIPKGKQEDPDRVQARLFRASAYASYFSEDNVRRPIVDIRGAYDTEVSDRAIELFLPHYQRGLGYFGLRAVIDSMKDQNESFAASSASTA